MQPTFMPWVGYMALMKAVDLFVFLDNVPFSPRSWQQRNQILLNQKIKWISLPIKTANKTEKILSSMLIAEEYNPTKHLKTIAHAYSKADRYQILSSDLQDAFENVPINLVDFNLRLIKLFCDDLGISTPAVRASEISGLCGRKADLIFSILGAVGADEYLAVPGSVEYTREAAERTKPSVKITGFTYTPVEYKQLSKDFVPYLSALDLMFNEGISRTTDLFEYETYSVWNP